MALTVGEMARRAGTTARVLRHYDARGLLRPAEVTESGYRWYDESQLIRLHRILALRRAGLGLTQIAEVLSDSPSEATALKAHLGELRAQRSRLDTLITELEADVAHLQTGQVADRIGFGAAFARERHAFAARLTAEYGTAAAESLHHAARPPEVADAEHLAARGARIMARLADLMTAGRASDEVEVLDAVGDHLAAVQQTWNPTAQAYRALGSAYVTDPFQRRIAQSAHPDLPDWLAAAIGSYATHRMTDPAS